MTPPLTSDQIAAIQKWITDAEDLVNSTGQHEEHSLTQIGRCVYCSCGKRFQGQIPKDGNS